MGIRSQLAHSDVSRRGLLTRHQSQNSMSAIVDLVQATKSNMSQTIDLEILNAHSSSDEDTPDVQEVHGAAGSNAQRLMVETSMLSLMTQSADDSFSDRLGFMEELIRSKHDEHKSQQLVKHEKHELSVDVVNMDESKAKIMHSDSNVDVEASQSKSRSQSQTQTHTHTNANDRKELDAKDVEEVEEVKDSSFVRLTQFLSSSSTASTFLSSDEDNDEDGPPAFWGHEAESSHFQRMLSNPDRVLDEVMSPIMERDRGSSSDWEREYEAEREQRSKKKRKAARSKSPRKKAKCKRKKRRKRVTQSVSSLEEVKQRRRKEHGVAKKRRSRQLSQEELQMESRLGARAQTRDIDV